MLAQFEENIYLANVNHDIVTLITSNSNKCIEGFEKDKNCYKKIVSIADARLKSIYEIHFWVKYQDCIEDTCMWNIDEGRAVGILNDVVKNEVVIAVDHDAMDDTWTQYEKGAACKKIDLAECTEYFIEKRYFKYNGLLIEKTEKKQISLEELKKIMITVRKESL